MVKEYIIEMEGAAGSIASVGMLSLRVFTLQRPLWKVQK